MRKPEIRIPLLILSIAMFLPGLLVAGWKQDTKIHFVEFQDAAGVRHLYPLEQPVSRGDALTLRGSLMGAAQKSGNHDFLQYMAEGGSYTDSGSICHVTSRSGGRIYYCGACGGLGCASVKAIQ